MSKKNDLLYILFRWIGAIGIFCLLFYLASNLVSDSSIYACPDEYMRYPMSQFIYNHGYLPKGDEKEIMNEIWGFSYGYTPYFPAILSALFMKITSFYSTSAKDLLTAARFTSVLSGVGTWIFVSKIGQEIFKEKKYAILLTLLVCLLPQFVYICSYVNNDAFSIFCSAIIVYAWIKNMKENWRIKDCILLGVGIGFLAITYYNAFGFILCSILVYIFDNIRKRNSFADFFKKAFLIFIVAFAIGGWFYIRNFIIHNGDFLGMKSMYASGEKYAQDIYKPSMRVTPKNLGISVYDMLRHKVLEQYWVFQSIVSFVGCFGYMSVQSPWYIILGYSLIFFIGCLCFLGYPFTKKWLNMKSFDWIMIWNCILCVIIPVGLSIYYSWATDFQAQGRYFMSAILPLGLLTITGFNVCFHKMSESWKTALTSLLMIGILCLFGVSIFMYLIPKCF